MALRMAALRSTGVLALGVNDSTSAPVTRTLGLQGTQIDTALLGEPPSPWSDRGREGGGRGAMLETGAATVIPP